MTTDTDFSDHKIASVEKQSDGTYCITSDKGWSLWCGQDCPVVPEIGQTARMYPAGAGGAVRGLFIDGTKVWYRTEAEEKEHHEIQMYGADAADWLARWDEGRSCWSIEMGGLGPGYEQCIHITAAELLRWLLDRKPVESDFNGDKWVPLRDEMQDAAFKNTVISDLGLSGAQYGAASNLACQFYLKGPRAVMTDQRVKDRHIQVSKSFPRAA